MKEENENIEQRLEHLKSGNSFSVPENYFEDFSQRLRARIEEESKPVRRISWFMYLKPALGIAAVLAIAFFLIKIPVNLSVSDQKLIANNSLTTNKPSNDTAAASLNDDLTATFESLVQLPQSQFLSTLEEAVSQDNKSQIDTKTLEEYLADNSFDYEIIGNN
jgi:hypothetical protein